MIAIEMLALMDGLTVSARRVGAALLRHFNRRTGQCNPGIDRLRRVLGIDRGSVISATRTLHDLDLIRKIPNGNRANRYQPNWARFREINDDWRARFRQTPVEGVEESQPPESNFTNCEGGYSSTQTFLRNILKEPSRARGGKSTPSSSAQSTNRPVGEGPIERTPDYNEAHPAYTPAQRRLDRGLTRLFHGRPEAHAAAIALIDPPLLHEATLAELRDPGSGLRMLQARLMNVTANPAPPSLEGAP